MGSRNFNLDIVKDLSNSYNVKHVLSKRKHKIIQQSTFAFPEGTTSKKKKKRKKREFGPKGR